MLFVTICFDGLAPENMVGLHISMHGCGLLDDRIVASVLFLFQGFSELDRFSLWALQVIGGAAVLLAALFTVVAN